MNATVRTSGGTSAVVWIGVAVAVAAPICYDVSFNTCQWGLDCGTSATITVCESSWQTGAPGAHKVEGPFHSAPRKCYTFTGTAVGECWTTYPGMRRIPSCNIPGSETLCCFYPEDQPPTVSDGEGNIVRPASQGDIKYCVGTGSPAYPF